MNTTYFLTAQDRYELQIIGQFAALILDKYGDAVHSIKIQRMSPSTFKYEIERYIDAKNVKADNVDVFSDIIRYDAKKKA